MTPSGLLERVAAGVSREAQRRIEKVDAVYDDELWAILRHFGLLDRLDAGELRCAVTGVPLTRDNIGGLIGTAEGPQPIASTYQAAAGLGNRAED
jgi:hypothetical protein